MIIIKYAKRTVIVQEIEEILQGLSLTFKLVVEHKVAEPTLIEGDQEIVGYTKIMEYLEALKAELHQWYYCDC